MGAKDTPFEDRKVTEGEKAGHNYLIRRVKNDNRIMFALIDTNFWKTQLHEGLRIGFGDKGCFSVFKVNNPNEHEFLAQNYRAEYPTETFGRGRKVEEWTLKPNAPDNHLLDTTCLAMVAASMEGVKFEHQVPAEPAVRRVARRTRLSERMQPR